MSRDDSWRGRLDAIATEAEPIAAALLARGHRAFLVGGIVRDVLLDRQRAAPDIDLTTDAVPRQIIECLRGVADDVWTQGERFGTIGCRVGGRAFEITTHRSEAYVSDSRKPVVEYSPDVEVDLSRRDFTVNAMAVELPGRDLIDPFGGERDLHERVLRTPLAPEVSFSDDPLRMLRAARFVAGYALVPAFEVEEAMCNLRARLAIVSRERVRDELERLLEVADPTSGFELLQRTGVLHEFAPEVAALPSGDLACTFDIVRRAGDPGVRRAGLFALVPDRNAVLARVDGLRYSNAQRRSLHLVLELLDDPAARDAPTAAWVRRTVHRIGACVDPALALLRLRWGDAAVAPLEGVYRRLAHDGELAELTPELDGERVQQLLGLTPGPAVGEALGFLLDLRLDHGRVGAAEAERRLLEWWHARG